MSSVWYHADVWRKVLIYLLVLYATLMFLVSVEVKPNHENQSAPVRSVTAHGPRSRSFSLAWENTDGHSFCPGCSSFCTELLRDHSGTRAERTDSCCWSADCRSTPSSHTTPLNGPACETHPITHWTGPKWEMFRGSLPLLFYLVFQTKKR